MTVSSRNSDQDFVNGSEAAARVARTLDMSVRFILSATEFSCGACGVVGSTGIAML